MEDLRRILSPLGQPIRRAVLLSTGLVADKKDHPELSEVDALSELCAHVFPVEPRHTPLLLRKAFSYNVDSAWQAIHDDLSCNIDMDASAYVEEFTRHMIAATSRNQMFSVCSFAVNTPQWHLDATDDPEPVDRLLDAFVRYLDTTRGSDMVELFQAIVARCIPNVDAVYTRIMQTPSSAVLFLRHPEIGHLVMKAGVGQHICEYATTLRPEDRYHPLAVVATLMQRGHSVRHAVGLDTLMALSSKRFDIGVAAAAAVIAREDENDVVRQLARLIESLAATISTYDGNDRIIESAFN